MPLRLGSTPINVPAFRELLFIEQFPEIDGCLFSQVELAKATGVTRGAICAVSTRIPGLSSKLRKAIEWAIETKFADRPDFAQTILKRLRETYVSEPILSPDRQADAEVAAKKRARTYNEMQRAAAKILEQAGLPREGANYITSQKGARLVAEYLECEALLEERGITREALKGIPRGTLLLALTVLK